MGKTRQINVKKNYDINELKGFKVALRRNQINGGTSKKTALVRNITDPMSVALLVTKAVKENSQYQIFHESKGVVANCVAKPEIEDVRKVEFINPAEFSSNGNSPTTTFEEDDDDRQPEETYTIQEMPVAPPSWRSSAFVQNSPAADSGMCAYPSTTSSYDYRPATHDHFKHGRTKPYPDEYAPHTVGQPQTHSVPQPCPPPSGEFLPLAAVNKNPSNLSKNNTSKN